MPATPTLRAALGHAKNAAVTPPPTPPPPPPPPLVRPPAARIREIALLYGATLVVTVGLTLMQASVGWIRSYTLVLVAATFLYLPIEVLHRRGEDPAAFGLHRRRPLRAVAFALLVMLATFPLYLVGFHLWQTEVLGQTPAPSEARFDRWPIELQDSPRVGALAEGEVRLHDADRRLWLRWHLPAGQRFEAVIESDGPLVAHTGPAERPALNRLVVDAGSDGLLVFAAPGERVDVAIDAGGDRLPAERLRLGTALVAAEHNPYRAERSVWWLINLILVQLLLVALPEEVFYRGYLQTRLDGLVGRDVKLFGVEVNLTSLLLTSALFAVAHFVTIPSPHRLAVFFPSLLFGWMRRATGGVIAPTIYHAACNLLVEVAAAYYD